MKKLAVFFPGRKYSVDCPLLYYADFVCKLHGYERMYMHYAAHREETSANTVEEDVQNATEYVLERCRKIDFCEYDEIVFVSKSIGTVLASIAQQELGLRVKNVYLTPLEPTLPYLKNHLNPSKDNLVIAGTADSFLNAEILREVCEQEEIELYQYEHLGHSMEGESVSESLQYIDKIIKNVEKILL